MRVYIDVVVIVNFLFDYFLLASVYFILRRNVKIKKIVFGSLIGCLTNLLLFVNIGGLYLFLFKIIISIFMIIGTFGYRNFAYFRKNMVYFYLVSMLLGGAIYFLKMQFSYSNHGLIVRDHALSISYVIIIVIGLLLYLKYIKYFKELRNNYSNYYNCEIVFDREHHFKVTAFLDTGNKLNDPYSNKSIILINHKVINNLVVDKPIYIPYNSLNNHGLLKCIKALKIIIDGKENSNFLVGISEEEMFIDGIDCIINNRIMEGLK